MKNGLLTHQYSRATLPCYLSCLVLVLIYVLLLICCR
uniref:Uncharacterized protein n=1 Tax=Arundo donax TaxID=35708 RepID=A0A0A9H8F9_ARUDO